MGRQQHRFHGDSRRFEVVAAFVAERYSGRATYVADVAGGQGMLSRLLNKKYGFVCEVIDPRGWLLKGVPHSSEEFKSEMADYYDLLVGLHPDGALVELVKAGCTTPAVVIPCCNVWSDVTLNQRRLLGELEAYYRDRHVPFERIALDFRGPKNEALISEPNAR